MENGQWPKKMTAYLHADKMDKYEWFEQLDMGEPAGEELTGALYEVEFDMLVNKDGTYKIVEVREGKNKLVPTE